MFQQKLCIHISLGRGCLQQGDSLFLITGHSWLAAQIKLPKGILGVLVSFACGHLQPSHGLFHILRHILPQKIHLPQAVLGVLISLESRLPQQSNCFFHIFWDLFSCQIQTPQCVLDKRQILIRRFRKPADSLLHVFWYHLSFQIQPSQTICRVPVSLICRFFKQLHCFFRICFYLPPFQIELCEHILGRSIPGIRGPFKPFQRLADIPSPGIQPELSQGILGIPVSQLCRQLPVPDGFFLILFCPDALIQHLPQTVLQPVIMALLLQIQKTGKSIPKMNSCLLH